MQRDRRLKRVSKVAIYNSKHNGIIMRLKEIQWPLLTKNIAYNGEIWRFNVIISQIRLWVWSVLRHDKANFIYKNN